MTPSSTSHPAGAGSSGGRYKRVRARRGTELVCHGWPQEAALRMLMNSLDEEVAERPEHLVVCGSIARPTQDWDAYHAILRSLQDLKDDETLLVRSGKPSGVLKTRAQAPRVLIVGSNDASPHSGGTKLPEPTSLGCALFGLDAARSWTFSGSQQALSTAFETFAAIGNAHFGGHLASKLIVSGGMGGAGGAQPLAATLNGAAFLGIDVDGERITRRIRAGYCDFCVNTLDEALRILKNAVRQRQPVSVGLVGNCAEVLPELASRGVLPDILTDLTGVCDLLNDYVPAGLTLQQAAALRDSNPEDYLRRATDSLVRHARGILELRKLGAVTFDFGNNLLERARERAGLVEAVQIPGFVSAWLRPAFSRGLVPVRWVALSGEASDMRRADNLLLELFPDDDTIARWIRMVRKYVKFQGLPARVVWMGLEQRTQYAARLNALVSKGEITAPMVIARDQMDCEAANSPNFAGLKEASEPAQDPSLLNALLHAGSGAGWVALQAGGTHTEGSACRTTQAVVADGSPDAAKSLERFMKNACGLGDRRRAGLSGAKPRDSVDPEPPAR